MTEELQNKLYEAYPKIFVEKDLPMSRTCMCWGICIDDGWFQIFDTMCNKLQEYSDKMGVQVIAQQVKEKIGELRFYYCVIHTVENISTDLDKQINKEIDKIVEEAEIACSKTCEQCGKPGKNIAVRGWYQTTCEECTEKRKTKNG